MEKTALESVYEPPNDSDGFACLHLLNASPPFIENRCVDFPQKLIGFASMAMSFYHLMIGVPTPPLLQAIDTHYTRHLSRGKRILNLCQLGRRGRNMEQVALILYPLR